ncbi:hypothetical protein ABZ464_21755 [Streptomyces sp. NPDC005820]|uniref:hypothetical protein n=1 Tax=Streptomyces sp. NPDC005820 TaxID=3157069 RepID=UPI0034054855
MPLAVEIVLIVIGILLLAAALIGSGISRRLMTIPKMKRAPRIVIAILGVLLLAGGMWGVTTEANQHGPSLSALKKHIPSDVTSTLTCREAAEAPKGAVKMDCSTQDSVPEQVWYVMFDNVNAMQDWWVSQARPSDLPGSSCATLSDFKKGSSYWYYVDDQSVAVGDESCYAAGNIVVAMYTDRRFNIVVWAQISDPKNFSEFQSWLTNTSRPTGPDDATPETPSQTPDGG